MEAVVAVDSRECELNSLLHRSLRLMEDAMVQLETAGDPMDPQTQTTLATRLGAVREVLGRLSGVLAEHSAGIAADTALLETRALADAVQHCSDLVAPEGTGIEIIARIAPDAGGVIVGPLATVVLTGIRNAVRATRGALPHPPRIELIASITAHRELVILISDNAPGNLDKARPGRWRRSACNHDIDRGGLGLCRQIVSELGGRLHLSEGPSGRGNRLRVEVPVGRLTRP